MTFIPNLSHHKKALVLGTGGGNDIVSATVVALQLQQQGVLTDLAGVNSPGAFHRYNGKLEQPVNHVDENTTRYLALTPEKQVSYVDATLGKTLKDLGIEIGKIYNFSTRFGTKALQNAVSQLIKDENYDLFVAVDVGGDILGNVTTKTVNKLGQTSTIDGHPTLLSPMMDFTSLNLIKHISIETLLIEFGLGTDGELRPGGMHQIIKEFQNGNMLKYVGQLTNQTPEIQTFRKIFEEVRKVRSGNTNVQTLHTLDLLEKGGEFEQPYKHRSVVGDQKRYTPFTVHIPYEFFGKVYTVDGKTFAENRPHTTFDFENSLQQFLKLKSMEPSWKTELDLFQVRSGDNWTTTEKKGSSVLCLTPTTMIPDEDRAQMIQAGCEQLARGEVDFVVILIQDLQHVVAQNFTATGIGKFALLGKNHVNNLKFNEIANQIRAMLG